MGAFNDIRTNPIYYEKNPNKKNYAWASEMVTILRRSLTPLVDPVRSKDGMEILMAVNNVDDVIKSFKEGSAFIEDVKPIVALPVFEKLRNILAAEFKKGTYMPELRAQDPTSDIQRTNDMTLLGNRHLLEGPMTELGSRVKRPPYKIAKENFNSNVDAFDEMGLNSQSPEDLSFFRKIFQKLDHEIAATDLLQALYDYNEFSEYSEELINDILAKKAIAFQVFESKQSGEFKWKYIPPEQVSWIRGKRRNGKDAAALAYEMNITVKAFLEMSAGYFDFDRDHHILLQAIRHTNGVSWTSLTYNGAFDEEGNCLANWSEVQGYLVALGYIEWKSVDAIAGKRNKRNGIYYPMANIDDTIAPNSIYQKEVTEFQNTYKSYFISTGMYQQYMWDFGPVYHQLTEGANDEYSNYTISVWVGTGKTAIEVSKPYLKICNYAFYKLMWGIYASKPNVEVYNVDSLINLLGIVQPATTGGPMGVQEPNRAGMPSAPSGAGMGQLEDLISWMRKSLIRFYSNGDQKMGGDGKAHYVEPGGIDPIAVAMQSVVDWAEAKISSNLGINALREGYTPDPKDGYKLNMESTKNSRSATYYIPDAIASCMRMICNNSMLLAQDCIELGGKGKDFLTNLISKKKVGTLKTLAKIPLHRYGMFVEVYNSEVIRDEIRQEAMLAYQKGDIQYHELLLIKEIPNPKNAAMTLAYFRERGVRQEREMAMQKYQMDIQMDNIKTQNQIKIENAKGGWKQREMDTWGNYYMSAHQTAADAQIRAKQISEENAPLREEAKAAAKVKEIQAQGNVELERPLPNTSAE